MTGLGASVTTCNPTCQRLKRPRKKSIWDVLVAQAPLPVRVLQSAHSQPLAGARDKEWLCCRDFSRDL